MLSLQTKVAVPQGVYVNQQAEGMVLMHAGSGLYFGLNQVGAVMWNALVERGSPEAALPVLRATFPNVDPQRLESDFLRLIDQLVQKGLLTIAG